MGITFRKLRDAAGSLFDPRLIDPVGQAARDFYRHRLPKAEFMEMELHPKDIVAGMTLSRDFFSGTGIMLLSNGTELDETNVDILRRYTRLDPAKRGVFVYVKEEDEQMAPPDPTI